MGIPGSPRSTKMLLALSLRGLYLMCLVAKLPVTLPISNNDTKRPWFRVALHVRSLPQGGYPKIAQERPCMALCRRKRCLEGPPKTRGAVEASAITNRPIFRIRLYFHTPQEYVGNYLAANISSPLVWSPHLIQDRALCLLTAIDRDSARYPRPD